MAKLRIQRRVSLRALPHVSLRPVQQCLFAARFLVVFALAWIGLGSACTATGQNPTPVNVPTWRYDNTHQGQNTQETLLTPANVNTSSFGKLFSVAVDGYVYAQPLYISGLTMNDGLVHNVLFVATEHDSVYALDADSNGGANASPLWQASMLSSAHGAGAGAATVTSADVGTNDIVPEIGITSTPVINPATNTIYVVAKTVENGNYIQRLHALNIITGAEQANSPVVISGSVPGSGNGSSGGQLAFSPLWQMNRVALGYYNGYIYMAFGAHGDNGPWHGWVFSYNASTLTQTGAICLSPSGFGNGVWGSGAGLPIDNGGTNGRMFLSTGNGSFVNYPPIAQNTDFGNSIVQLSLANGAVTATDAFTPYNQASLTNSDTDQGSGGVLLLPDQQGSHPHILLQIGKDGTIEVVNRDGMGGYLSGASSNTNILQDIDNGTRGMWSTPAYWNGNVYTWASQDVLKQFQLNSGVLTPSPSSESAITSSFPGASPVISSNGTQNGVLWAVRSDQYNSSGPEVLYAFNPNNVSTIYYESDTNARDNAGTANKFVVPVVTNGKVYVGAAYQVNVYGLLSGETATANPAFNPGGGSFATSASVTISSTTPNATIYYTTDGTTPTTASSVYSAPLNLTTDTVLSAIASAEGYLQSGVTSATYTFAAQTPPVTFMPAGGTYGSAQTVTLSDTDTSANIYYTTDGSIPTTSSAVYSGPIAVTGSTTIKALAHDGSSTTSNVSTAAYVISSSGSMINFGSGFASVVGLTLNGNAKNSDDSRLQLTDGGTQEASSVFYSTPVNIQSFVTDFSFQLSDAQADGFTFTVQNAGVNTVGEDGGGLGYGGMGQSAAIKFDFYNNAGEGTDSTGLFTNGAYPTTPAIDLTSSGIQLNSGDSIQAQLSYNGTVLTLTLNDVVVNKTFTQQFTVNIPQLVGGNTAFVGFTGGAGGLSSSQKILSWTYASSAPQSTAASPGFTPGGGNYTTPQSVALTSATTGAAIYYTTDGSQPTTNSSLYSTSIPVPNGTTVINAIATASGLAQSPVSTATYVVTPVTPAPVFSIPGGNYTSKQTVAITDAGATIYYTTNGSTATTSSTVYSAPITVNTGTTTINAIAIATGSSQSTDTAATYVVTAQTTPNPTFTPAAGSYTSAQNVTLADSLSTAVIYYTTNGTAPTTSSAVYSAAIPVGTGTTTIKALAVAPGDTASAVVSAAYTVTAPVTATPSFTPPAGSYTAAQNVVLADTTANAVIYYTTNGTTPTTSSAVYSAAIPVGIGTTTIKALAVAPGDTASAVVSAAYTVTAPVTATPSFTPPAGSYTAAQNVVLADTTANAVIYYTTNGTTPTTSSAVYSTSIPVGTGTTTIKALAAAPGDTASAVVSAAYTVTPAVTATPSFTPPAGSYTSAQSVMLADTTANAVIYYTTNGTTPTTSSAVYSTPIPVAAGKTTLEAIAVAPALTASKAVTAAYTVTLPIAGVPSFTPAAGTYTTAQSVMLGDAVAGATIYYTIDGTTPTTSSPVYSTPVQVAASETIKAFAVASGYQNSGVATAAYLIQAAPPTLNYPSGFTSSAGLALNGSAAVVPQSSALQLVNSTQTQAAGSAWYVSPVNISTFTTDFTFQFLNAVADGMTFTIQNQGPQALGPNGSGLGYGAQNPGGTGGIPNSVAVKFDIYNNDGEGNDSIGGYADGASPTTPAIDLTSTGIVLSSGHIFHEHIVNNGSSVVSTLTDTTTNVSNTQNFPGSLSQVVGSSTAYIGFTGATGGSTTTANILSWTFSNTVAQVAAEPKLSPAPGTYKTSTSVSMVPETNASTIHYTVDGSQPNATSPAYHGPIVVNGRSLTVKAYTVTPGKKDSPIVTGTYQIQ